MTLTWPVPAQGNGQIYYYFVYRSTTAGTETFYTYTTTPSFADTGATNGTTYYYKVTAVNGYGEGPKSNEASATPAAGPTAPAAPVVTAVRGSGSVGLSWPVPASNGSAITGYKIYRSTTSGNEVLLPGPLVGPNSFNDTGLTNGTSYFYKVTAVNGIGEGPLSGEVSAVPATTPGIPVPVATPGNASVSLSWPAPLNNGSTITSYKVYRSTSSGGESFLNSTASGSFTDTTVSNGTQYFYKVSAVNSVGEGTLSGEVSATPVVPAATVPAAPVISATAGDTTVGLSWSAPATGGSPITGYKIYRSTTAGSELFLIANGSTAFTDTGRTNGTTYFYKVTAVNGIGEGLPSNEASATPVAVAVGPQPGAPVLTATPHNASVTLTWPVPAQGTGPIMYYFIYRSTTAGAETFYTYSTTPTYADTAAANTTTYFYKVTATAPMAKAPNPTKQPPLRCRHSPSRTPRARTPPPAFTCRASGHPPTSSPPAAPPTTTTSSYRGLPAPRRRRAPRRWQRRAHRAATPSTPGRRGRGCRGERARRCQPDLAEDRPRR